MPGNRQQGTYLGVFILAFSLAPAGLIALANHHPLVGAALTASGLALFVRSLVGFYRIKRLEFNQE